jgi:hypothetical protein
VRGQSFRWSHAEGFSTQKASVECDELPSRGVHDLRWLSSCVPSPSEPCEIVLHLGQHPARSPKGAAQSHTRIVLVAESKAHRQQWLAALLPLASGMVPHAGKSDHVGYAAAIGGLAEQDGRPTKPSPRGIQSGYTRLGSEIGSSFERHLSSSSSTTSNGTRNPTSDPALQLIPKPSLPAAGRALFQGSIAGGGLVRLEGEEPLRTTHTLSVRVIDNGMQAGGGAQGMHGGDSRGDVICQLTVSPDDTIKAVGAAVCSFCVRVLHVHLQHASCPYVLARTLFISIELYSYI